MKARRIVGLTLAAVLALAVLPAARGDDAVKNPWSIGARGGYLWVPDAFLSPFYKKHTQIDGGFVGLYGSYAFPTFEVDFGTNYYPIGFRDGKWLKRGDEPDQTDFVKARLGMVDIDVSVLAKWRLHPYVAWRLGAGLGFGFLFGPYTSWDVIDGVVRWDKKSTPQKPSVIPVLTIQTGPTFYFVPDRFGLNIDFGFKDGVFVGGGLQGWF